MTEVTPAELHSGLAAWTRLMIRRRWLVIGLWFVVLLASVAAATQLTDLLSNRFSIPGSDTHKVERLLEDHYGVRSDGSINIVVVGDNGSARSLVEPARAAAERAASELPKHHGVTVIPLSDSAVVATISTNFEPVEAKAYTADLRAAAKPVRDATVYVTGQGPLTGDLDPVTNDDLKRGELYFALPVALLILAFVFGSLGFLLPFMFALAAIPATLGVVFVFANFMNLSSYVMNLVVGIGLGVSIDYSLLMYYRYREERHHRQVPREDAVVNTMVTSGRAVIFSGSAVAIGLATMVFMPLPFLRGFGVAGLVIPIVSVICALTLMPALMYMTADWLERMRFLPQRMITRRDDTESNGWARFARSVMRRPAIYFASSAIVLLGLSSFVLKMDLIPGSNAGIPQHLESVRGMTAMEDALGKGAVTPTEIIVDTGRKGGAREPQVLEAATRLAQMLRDDRAVAAVQFAPAAPFIDESRRYVRISAPSRYEYGDERSSNFARRLRGEYVDDARFPDSARVYAGGGPPAGIDLLDRTYDAFPWVIAGVLALTFLLLLRAFRSIVLPLKAIVLNLLSIGAAYGFVTLVFSTGIAEAVGLTPQAQVEFWIPVFMFAMLFGLSMDYEVFLVSRMREEWDATHDNQYAVAAGLAKTGRLVTAAGMIMVAAFAGFMLGSIVGLQQFGLGLATAILIDVTVVRALLLPSAMRLFGRWNWWLPDWVARLARVEPSPLDAPLIARAESAPSPG